jgi:3-oxoacyl-[acyl-carrier protein] reductase
LPDGCALVTGGAVGIGAAVARRLAADGRPVAVNYRSSAEPAQRLVAEIEEAGGRALALHGDVSSAAAVDELFAAAEGELGPVLVLVNNAGVRADGLAVSATDEAWSRVLQTNLDGVFYATRRALMPMIRARFGRIVNIASVAGLRASPGQVNYSAAKAGVLAMTRTVAVEVARRGVTVNAVAPGLIETAMTDDVATELVAHVPARRMGGVDEVAACVGFLTSEEASYVTGAVLTVDGGLSA